MQAKTTAHEIAERTKAVEVVALQLEAEGGRWVDSAWQFQDGSRGSFDVKAVVLRDGAFSHYRFAPE